jgi:hypothetical protein
VCVCVCEVFRRKTHSSQSQSHSVAENYVLALRFIVQRGSRRLLTTGRLLLGLFGLHQRKLVQSHWPGEKPKDCGVHYDNTYPSSGSTTCTSVATSPPTSRLETQ